jgi:TPR repeat protein
MDVVGCTPELCEVLQTGFGIGFHQVNRRLAIERLSRIVDGFQADAKRCPVLYISLMADLYANEFNDDVANDYTIKALQLNSSPSVDPFSFIRRQVLWAEKEVEMPVPDTVVSVLESWSREPTLPIEVRTWSNVYLATCYKSGWGGCLADQQQRQAFLELAKDAGETMATTIWAEQFLNEHEQVAILKEVYARGEHYALFRLADIVPKQEVVSLLEAALLASSSLTMSRDIENPLQWLLAKFLLESNDARDILKARVWMDRAYATSNVKDLNENQRLYWALTHLICCKPDAAGITPPISAEVELVWTTLLKERYPMALFYASVDYFDVGQWASDVVKFPLPPELVELPKTEQDSCVFNWLRYVEQAIPNMPMVNKLLSHCLLKGIGVPQDCAEGIAHLKRCADSGWGIVCWELGSFYEEAEFGLHKDMKLAAEYYKRAVFCDRGPSLYAHRCYGNCLLKGLGVARDPISALEILEDGAAKNLPSAISGLANVYALGLADQPADLKRARSLYVEAATQSDVEALLWLKANPEERKPTVSHVALCSAIHSSIGTVLILDVCNMIADFAFDDRELESADTVANAIVPQ